MQTHPHDLSRVIVRLLKDPSEIDRWNETVATEHYLKSSRMMGEQLRYVAELNGYWVACIGWSAAALKLSDRSTFVGWTPIQERQRLHLVAQNARFLILSTVKIANLASRVLALNLRELSADWQREYGHPIWMAETFVEEGRNDGTCYRACNWTEVGKTKGFRRVREGYRQHGVVKLLFMKELLPGARKRLAAQEGHPEDRPLKGIELATQPIDGSEDASRPSLFTIITTHITDPRTRRGRQYSTFCMMAILLCGIVAGETTVAGIAAWAKGLNDKEKRRLKCPGGFGAPYRTPCATNLGYFLQDLEPAGLNDAVRAWVAACGINTTTTHIAIDGKVLCGSVTPDAPAKAQLNALHVECGIVIDQVPVAEKSSEVPAGRVFAERTDLTNTIVTADAAHTNPQTATKIAEKGGSMCWPSRATNHGFSRRRKTLSPRQA